MDTYIDVPTTGIKLSYLLSVLKSRLQSDKSVPVKDFLGTWKEDLNAEVILNVLVFISGNNNTNTVE